MERWAANTLRTLGIILTAGFVLITSLFLLLLSMCAAQGGFGGNKHPEQAVPYLAAAVAVVVLGIWFIAWLARGILRSTAIAEPLPAGAPPGVPPTQDISPASSVPLHLSPLGRKSIDRLVFAFIAQIAVSAAAWLFNQLHFWSTPRNFAPFPAHNWIIFLLIPYVLYHLPYAILIYVLLKRPDRRAFAYSLAVPAVLIMQALVGLGYIGLFAGQHPMALILLVIPWIIHIVIIILAYQAIQQVGLHPPPSSLIVAAVVTFFYFSAIHVITPLLFRFASK
jgi:hypothetical protein